MADQINEKPEVEATAPGAQEVPAAEKPTEPSSIGSEAAKADGEANKGDTKTAEETKEVGNSEKPAEDKDAAEAPKEDSKPTEEGADTEMKDATEAPAGQTKAENSAPSADGETATENAATESALAKAKNNRRKSTGGASRKSLSKKASKARLTHLDAKPGDHFLVKLKGFPAWPAIICDESIGWVPNTGLTELTPEKARETITEKMRKDLKEAFSLAAEHNSIEHYKDVLKQFQDELLAKQQAAATPKKSKKGKAKAADEDVEMEDADDASEKSKSKKRKAEDDASTPQRPESVKKPKIKLNTSTPKAANGTPKAKEESAAKTKVKVKKSSDKKAETTKKAKMTPEERRHHKEKEVLYLRHKLQRGLLTRDQQPQESEMEHMSEYVTMLENLKDLEVSIIRATKINKVLKAILKLESIPREDDFHFKDRSKVLLDQWTQLLATENTTPAPDATNGVNGKSEAKPDDKKDDSGKETTEEPKPEATKTEETKTEKPEEIEEEKIAETPQASAPEEKKDDTVAPPEPVEAAA
ncbi:hypothetical protein ACJA88_003174 [Fusarium oxysporum]